MLKSKDRNSIERSLMPPPLSVSRSRTDYSFELKRNLIGNMSNIQENNYLKDELTKIINEKNKDYPKLDDDFTYDYLNLNISNNDLLKLKNGLENNKNKEHNLLCMKYNKKLTFKKFNKLPSPQSKIEIKIFVDNLISYINYLYNIKFLNENENWIKDFHNNFLLNMKIKIQTRYNDYKNKGINYDNFIQLLNNMQEEFINKLINLNLGLKLTNWANKELINESNCNFKLDELIEEQNSFDFINKKRKRNRCLSEMKSITSSSSSSYDDVDSNIKDNEVINNNSNNLNKSNNISNLNITEGLCNNIKLNNSSFIKSLNNSINNFNTNFNSLGNNSANKEDTNTKPNN